MECLTASHNSNVREISFTQHRGVKTLEQRQSVGLSTQINCKIRNITEKEDTTMTKPKNSEALKPHRDFRNLFLLALHVGVLVVSLWVHPIGFTPADRALPYAV